MKRIGSLPLAAARAFGFGFLAIGGPVDAIAAILGADLAMKQLNRSGIVITSVDGAPDIVGALKGRTQVQASASQDPYAMGKLATEIGYGIMNGKKPENAMTLLPSTLVTRENVGSYPGWSR